MSSIIVQSLEEMKLRAPAVGAKRWCFLIVTLDLPARSLYKYCVMVFGSILMQFSKFFFRCTFQMHYIVLIFVARWRHNFREIAVVSCEK